MRGGLSSVKPKHLLIFVVSFFSPLWNFLQHCHLQTLRRTLDAVFVQRLPGLAAEMAFNATLSLFPAILMVLTAIGLFRPLKLTFQDLAWQVSRVAPVEVLGLIEGFANQVSRSQDRGLFSLSFAFALWSASGALNAAMTALDQIHKIPHQRRRPFWQARLIALVLTVGTLLLLMLASTLLLISDVVIQHVAGQTPTFSSGILMFWQFLTLPLALGIMSIAFAWIYRLGPSYWQPGQPLFPGAILAAVSWACLSNSLRQAFLYFGPRNQVYGVVGAVIVLLLWLYISSLVLLLGEQLNFTVGEAMQEARIETENIKNQKFN